MGAVGFTAAGLGGVSVVWGLGCPGGVSLCFCGFGGVSVVSRRYLGVVSWWFLGGVSVVSRWCLGGVSVVSVVSR